MIGWVWAMVLGCATQDATSGAGTLPEAGLNMVHITDSDLDFWIDQYEFPNVHGEKPTTYVNLEMAAGGCAAKGKRLCTAAEWRRACQGPGEGLRYGYGAKYERGRCHSGKRLPSGHTSMIDPDTLVASSGVYPDCTTPDGLHDMIGNLEEWVLDDWRGVDGMLEGGAWYTHTRYADCSGWYSREPDYRLDPSRKVFSAGFRCCWTDEEPDEAAISSDAKVRLETAAAADSEADYAPEHEVALGPETFIDTFEYPNQAGEQPRVVVSWEEAESLCQANDKRLCSAVEWELACGGEKGWAHPYGPKYVPSACGVNKKGAAASGTYLGCASPSGARDMVGSVWEWTSTPLDVFTLTSNDGETLRELRGGSWYVDPEKGRCSPVQGYPAATQDGRFPDVGFRCCRGPELEQDIEPEEAAHDCAKGMVAIGDFCIDRYEHPNVRWGLPASNMDFNQAKQACEGRGMEMCTTNQWEQACRGSQGRRWPYGNTYVAGRCHDKSADKEQDGQEAMRSAYKAECKTPEGVYDMSGNLWEWTQTSKGKGAMRGGGWNISSGLGMCRSGADASGSYKSKETGVRCCTPAP
jgi:formylglycine-generating enzyme required for sulfatase activity